VSTSRADHPPNLVWDWSVAALGAVYALPAAVVALSDRQKGIALALGVLPGAIAGLLPRRRGRLAIVVLGAAIGVPMFLGGLLAGVPVLAVVAIAALGIGAATLAGRFRLGTIAMTLCLPMFGVGLSYPDVGKAAGIAGLMVLGSVFACLVSMLWPERPPPARRATPPPGAKPTRGYGVRLGAAGATAAAIGFILDLEHVGWACAAALLVMRPSADMQRLRSAGRILAVAIGALAGAGLVRLNPPAVVYSVALIAAIAGAGATHRSRWYVTAAFTTFLVFLLLLYSDPQTATKRFNERLLETVLGVAIAYFYGLALPVLVQRRRE
jgi:Fusaric acid resistance protein-like